MISDRSRTGQRDGLIGESSDSAGVRDRQGPQSTSRRIAGPVSEFLMPATDSIVQGPGARRELPAILKGLDASRVLVITGRSLGASQAFGEIARALAAGEIEAATHVGTVAHNPVESIMAIVDMAAEFRPHAIVSFGGGTPVDAAKLTALALAAGATERSTFLAQAVQFSYPDIEFVREITGSFIPIVAIPTTLSAAEWDGFASCVDTEDHRKVVFRQRRMTPRVVILDPELARMTPRDLWITSGVRAIDHAVESIYSSMAYPYATSLALGALELLSANLADSAGSLGREDAILACQVATSMSICGIHTVSLGLSHALGHQLGALGVPHGVTSCLTLPHVMRFLEPVTKVEQQRIARALCQNPQENRPAADLVAELLEVLAVPRRIRDFAIGLDDLEAIAERALTDVIIRECPVELSRDSLRDLLKQAW